MQDEIKLEYELKISNLRKKIDELNDKLEVILFFFLCFHF